MKSPDLRRRNLPVAVVIVLAVAACSDATSTSESAATSASYQAELRTALNDFSTSMAAGTAEADAQTDFLAVNQVYYARRAESVSNLTTQLERAHPHEAAAEAHRELKAKADIWSAVAVDLADQISGAESEDDLTVVDYDETYDAALAEFVLACFAVETVLQADDLCSVVDG